MKEALRAFSPSGSCLNLNGKMVMDVSGKGRPALVRDSGAASGGPDRPGAGCAAADDRLLFDEAHKAIVDGRLYLDRTVWRGWCGGTPEPTFTVTSTACAWSMLRGCCARIRACP